VFSPCNVTGTKSTRHNVLYSCRIVYVPHKWTHAEHLVIRLVFIISEVVCLCFPYTICRRNDIHRVTRNGPRSILCMRHWNLTSRWNSSALGFQTGFKIQWPTRCRLSQLSLVSCAWQIACLCFPYTTCRRNDIHRATRNGPRSILYMRHWNLTSRWNSSALGFPTGFKIQWPTRWRLSQLSLVSCAWQIAILRRPSARRCFR
jgi:hypothetical protein